MGYQVASTASRSKWGLPPHQIIHRAPQTLYLLSFFFVRVSGNTFGNAAASGVVKYTSDVLLLRWWRCRSTCGDVIALNTNVMERWGSCFGKGGERQQTNQPTNSTHHVIQPLKNGTTTNGGVFEVFCLVSVGGPLAHSFRPTVPHQIGTSLNTLVYGPVLI